MEQNRKVSFDNNGNFKLKKQNLNLQKKKKQPSFGICFDVDGVLARGTIPLDAAKKAFKKLVDDNKDLKIPTVFVTNALNRNCDKAKQLEGWLETPIVPQQMIQAQGPLEIFTKYHDKFCLVIGQGKVPEIAKELGFKNICFIEDVADAYPLLDMVDHDNRKRIAASTTPVVDKSMARIEAIILLGEPKRWESSLQLIIDLLKTDGKPNQPPEAMPEEHLPVIACNMDLQFMDRACMPRYGHGAYLLCLEALYKKVVGRELKYTALIGKPSEITFRYAEHCLSREAKRLGYEEPLKHMYLIGDTPEVDIVGSNLYQRYVDRLHTRNSGDNNSSDESDKENKLALIDSDLPESRNIPDGTSLSKQTVDKVISILVCTGVYKPGIMPEPGSEEEEEKHYHGHRDFPKINELYKPTKLVANVDEAIDYILQHEKVVVQ
jgi:HAD superfamily hydrolase (TIGR01456 family)